MISRAKRLARHLVQRSIVPHLDAQVDQIDAIISRRLAERTDVPEGVSPSPILTDFNHLLHELRTIELRTLPVDGGVLLSAGCSGRWYFDWVAESVGPMERHIGVELYSPRPDDLPDGATWIAESASRMPGVADGSVDVVFSGQNIEHVWIDDMVGFLTESRRVLRVGGALVVDSPNRLATEALGWVHPEHAIEMTAAEATTLFEAAGFSVVKVRGLWNCRDRRSRAWLPLAVPPGDVGAILDRSVSARDVDDDFVWWIEAHRLDVDVDTGHLRELVTDLFRQHWTARVNRAATCPGERSADGTWRVTAGSAGVVYRTERFPVFAGSATVRSSDPALRVRVVGSDGSELGSGEGSAELSVDQAEFGVSAELVADHPLAETLTDVHVRVDVTT